MCVKILEAAGKINMDEYQFFLRGGIVSRIKIKISANL
jgi:dynein heavy chain